MPRNIHIGDDPVLRRKTQIVSQTQLKDQAIQDLADELLTLTEKLDGLGIAAPQVGESLRICVAVLAGRAQVLINPRIVDHSIDKALGEEGCLSFPGLFGKVSRFESVTIEAQGRDGSPMHLELEKMDARVAQHEIDHLDGVVLPDRLSENKDSR